MYVCVGGGGGNGHRERESARRRSIQKQGWKRGNNKSNMGLYSLHFQRGGGGLGGMTTNNDETSLGKNKISACVPFLVEEGIEQRVCALYLYGLYPLLPTSEEDGEA